MNATIQGLTYAGTFYVDSGQAMVGDPCYLDNWEPWVTGTPFEHEKHKGEYSYLGASGTTLHDNYGELGHGQAVAFSTGYGDGAYPVYVQLNSDNRVVKVVIDFEGDLDQDDE